MSSVVEAFLVLTIIQMQNMTATFISAILRMGWSWVEELLQAPWEIKKTTRFGSLCPLSLQTLFSQLPYAGTPCSRLCWAYLQVSVFQLSSSPVPLTWASLTHELAKFLLLCIFAFSILDVILLYTQVGDNI